MSVLGIGDLAIKKNLTGFINKSKDEAYKISVASSSNVKEQHYYDMDSKIADQSIEVEMAIQVNNQKIKDSEWMLNLLYKQENSIRNIFDLCTETKKVAVIAINHQGTTARPNIKMEALSILSRLQQELQSSYFGMNIWNGSRTNEIPFLDIVNTTNIVGGEGTAKYYLGDDFGLKISVEGQEFEYGDRADQEGFMQLITTLNLLCQAQDVSGAIDKNIVTQAADVLNTTPQKFADMLEKVGHAEKFVLRNIADAENTIEDLGEMYFNNLNGMNDENRALLALDIVSVQNKLNNIFYMTKTLMRDMQLINYL